VARQVGEEVRKRKRLGFHLVGFINAPPTRNDPSTTCVGNVLGDPAQMDRIIEQNNVDKIVVAITERRGEYPVKEMLALRVNGCQVVEWPGFFEKLSGRIPIDSLAPSFFIFNEGFRKSRILLWIRRIVSVIVATVLLILLLPVLLVVAFLIKLDSPARALFADPGGAEKQADPDLQIPLDAERRGEER